MKKKYIKGSVSKIEIDDVKEPLEDFPVSASDNEFLIDNAFHTVPSRLNSESINNQYQKIAMSGPFGT
jgi:hypothetical protein